MIAKHSSRASRRPRFLIVRHRKYQRNFFDVIVQWTSTNFPELASLFEVRDLPVRINDWSPYCLHAAWLQDPVQQWSAETHEQALELAAECDRRGVPIINRVDHLLNATKSRGARLMSAAGVATPRMEPIVDRQEFEATQLGLRLPLFIREDWGHSRNVFRVDEPDDARRVPWSTFERPLAVEIVDVRNPDDGLHRKFRYVAVGGVGVSHHLQISQEWVTRGENRVITPATRLEELNYLSQPDPNHALLQRASQSLQLDLVAFDYGYSRDGRMIVWEANPFPTFKFASQRLTYRNPAMHRTMAAILRMYLLRADLPVPAALEAASSLDWPGVERAFTYAEKLRLKDRWRAWKKRFYRAA